MTRQALLASAQRSFAEDGYIGASLDRIAADAGYTKGAVYAHFASKEALFLALLAEGLNAQIAELRQIVEAAEKRPESLGPDLARWLDGLDRPGSDARADLPLLGLDLQVESRRNPGFAGPFNDVIGAYRRALRDVIAHLLDIEGVTPRIDLDQMAQTLVAVSEGLALTRASGLGGAVAPASLVIRILLGLEPAAQPKPIKPKRTPR